MIFRYSLSILPPPTFPLQLRFDGSVVRFSSNRGSVYPSKVPNWNRTAPELYPNRTNGSVQFGTVLVRFTVRTGSHLNRDIPNYDWNCQLNFLKLHTLKSMPKCNE